MSQMEEKEEITRAFSSSSIGTRSSSSPICCISSTKSSREIIICSNSERITEDCEKEFDLARRTHPCRGVNIVSLFQH